MGQTLSKQSLMESMRLACSWLTDIAQTKHARLCDEGANVKSRFNYDDFSGSIKGEYWAATRQWSDFCLIWHTGQAVSSLARAARTLDEASLLDAARYSANFILRYQVRDRTDKDFGLILAFEGEPFHLNGSAIMEAMLGLLDLHEITKDDAYLTTCDMALQWIADKMYVSKEGLFEDVYFYDRKTFCGQKDGVKGRPLAEDAVFLTVGKLCKNAQFVSIFYETLERLLKDEDPPGNWIMYPPCDSLQNTIHPRHAYWWGNPFIDGWLDKKEQKYLDAAIRAGQWYVNAQRCDGGLFRHTTREFRTSSFGHATSGIACAAKMWARLWQVTGDSQWVEPTRRALQFCLNMQVRQANDKNLQGVIIEKILPPDGTDNSLIHIRDLGTIFFVQAACEVIDCGLIDQL